VVQSHAPSRREPTLMAERILMVDFASTQDQAKEVAPPASRKGEQANAAAAKPLSTSPPLTTDGMDKMYLQLVEIHAIAAMQLAECAHWHRFDSTPSLVQAGTGQLRPITMPAATRLAPSPQLISHPRPRYGGRNGAMSPRLTETTRSRCPSTAH
jgi:hypothetical protein